MLNHDYKNNDGRNLQFTRFSFIDFVLTYKRSLSGTRLKTAIGKSSSCRFSFSAEKNTNTKATECASFGLFFFFKQSLNLIVIQRYGFFSFLAAIIRESSGKQLASRIVKALPFIHQPDRVAPKASDVQQLFGYINTREYIRYFFTLVVTAFLRAGNPCITPQLM